MGNQIVDVPPTLTCSRVCEGQRLGLREDVRQQHVVVPAERSALGEGDEVTGMRRSLGGFSW